MIKKGASAPGRLVEEDDSGPGPGAYLPWGIGKEKYNDLDGQNNVRGEPGIVTHAFKNPSPRKAETGRPI